MKQLFSYCRISILSDKLRYAAIYFCVLTMFFCGLSAEYIKLSFPAAIICFALLFSLYIYSLLHGIKLPQYVSLMLADILFGMKWHGIYHGLKFAPAFGISIPFLIIALCFTVSCCFLSCEKSPDMRLCIICVSADVLTNLLLLR